MHKCTVREKYRASSVNSAATEVQKTSEVCIWRNYSWDLFICSWNDKGCFFDNSHFHPLFPQLTLTIFHYCTLQPAKDATKYQSHYISSLWTWQAA